MNELTGLRLWRAKSINTILRIFKKLADVGIVSAFVDEYLRANGTEGPDEPLELRKIKSVAVLRFDEIGDLVLTSPLLRELRRNLPEADITLIVKLQNKSLVEKCPYVNRVLGLPMGGFGGWSELRRMSVAWGVSRKQLWKLHLDLAIVPRWDMDVAGARMLAQFSGARWRIGFADPNDSVARITNAPLTSPRLMSEAIVGEPVLHEALRPLELLKHIGGTVSSDRLEIWTDGADEKRAADLIAGEKRPLIAFAISALSEIKRWPVERYGEVARFVNEKLGAAIVLIGGADDRELAARMKGQIDFPLIDATGALSLRETAALLKRCRMYIGNDTGPLHIAAAAGLAIAAIYCHPIGGDPAWRYSPQRFGPWGVPSRVLQPRALAPCVDLCRSGFEAHCILNVTVPQVINAVASLWDEVAVSPATASSLE